MGYGSPLYANWRAFADGRPGGPAWEYGLHTDAFCVGEVRSGLGPYKLFNTVAQASGVSGARLGIVLRVDLHLEGDPPLPDWSATTFSEFTGLTLDEEFAVLLSLALGARVRGGGSTRWFRDEPDADPLGEPVQWDHEPQVLPLRGRGIQIPRLMAFEARLSDCVEVVSLYPNMGPRSAVRLIRAAHLYRNALWVSEADPAQSWLFLIGAIETIAQDTTVRESSMELLEENWPELAVHLRDSSADKALIDQLAQLTRAGAKFRRTIIEFLPPPPSQRGAEEAQVDWDDLGQRLDKVYFWRSKALHDGLPLPPSMTYPAYRQQQQGNTATFEILERIPHAMAQGSGVWREEDSPMLLHVFEYIVRGVLIGWWRATAANETQASPADLPEG